MVKHAVVKGVDVIDQQAVNDQIRAMLDSGRVLAAVLVLAEEDEISLSVIAPPSRPLVQALEQAVAGYRQLIELTDRRALASPN